MIEIRDLACRAYAAIKEVNMNRSMIFFGVYLITVVTFIYLTVSYFYGIYIDNFGNEYSTKQGDWGTFGDFMGGMLNPVLGIVSVSALMVTLLMQINEFSKTTKALEEQNDSIDIQSFKNNFFALLTIGSDLVKGLESEDGEIKGRKFLKQIYKKINSELTEYTAPDIDEEKKTELAIKVKDIYPWFNNLEEDEQREYLDTVENLCRSSTAHLNSNRHLIEHYLKHVEQIILFILSENKLDSNGKERFLDILKSQMSVYELMVFNFHCFSFQSKVSDGFFSKLIELDFFENLSEEFLKDEFHRRLSLDKGIVK